MQKITGELIEKFFSGDCTEEEAAMVLKYLKENPDDQYLLHEWKNTDDKTPLQLGYSEAMLEAVVTATTEEKPKRIAVLKSINPFRILLNIPTKLVEPTTNNE